MPRKTKAFICSHFSFQVTVGKQRQFPIRIPCCTYSVPMVCGVSPKMFVLCYLSFSYDLEEIWIHRFLKRHTCMCTHAQTHSILTLNWMQLKNCSLHRETDTFGRCSMFRTVWLCHLVWLVVPITTKAYCRIGLKSRASSLLENTTGSR